MKIDVLVSTERLVIDLSEFSFRSSMALPENDEDLVQGIEAIAEEAKVVLRAKLIDHINQIIQPRRTT